MVGEKVDENVSEYEYREANDAFVYWVDYEEDESPGFGTLKQYAMGKSAEIADEVTKYFVLPNGNVAYITDYRAKKEAGDLYLFTGEESVLVDEDVTKIASIYAYWASMREDVFV